jgi:hypothetical protein
MGSELYPFVDYSVAHEADTEDGKTLRAFVREVLCTTLERGTRDDLVAASRRLRETERRTLWRSEFVTPRLELAFGPCNSALDPEGHKIGMALVYAGMCPTVEEHALFQQWWRGVVLRRDPPVRDFPARPLPSASATFGETGDLEGGWIPYREAYEWVLENPDMVRTRREADCELLGVEKPGDLRAASPQR